MIRRLPGDHEAAEMPESACEAFSELVERLTYQDLRLTLSNALASGSEAVGMYAAQNVGRIWRRVQ